MQAPDPGTGMPLLLTLALNLTRISTLTLTLTLKVEGRPAEHPHSSQHPNQQHDEGVLGGGVPVRTAAITCINTFGGSIIQLP